MVVPNEEPKKPSKPKKQQAQADQAQKAACQVASRTRTRLLGSAECR